MKNAARLIRGAALIAIAWGLGATARAELVSTFQAADGSWQLGTIAVANLDSSPDLEIVIPYRSSSFGWCVDAFKYTGQRLPGFPYATGPDPLNVSPTIADVDGDGREEIIITRANSVVALKANGSVLWSTEVTPGNYLPNGGFHTITNGFYWSNGGGFMERLPGSTVFSSEVSSPVVVNLSGTGRSEVVTAWKIDPDPTSGDQDYNPFIYDTFGVGQWGLMGETWSGSVITFDALTGGRTFAYHMHHLVESGLAVGRANRTGPLDVYELNDSDSVVAFDKTKPFGLWGKGMLHKQFGKNQRLMTGSYQLPVDIQAADIDGDGLDEVLVPGTQASTLWQPNDTVLDDDGSILWRRWLPSTNVANNSGWLNSASLIACNPDHDNRADVLGWSHGYEITFRTWNGADFVDRPGWPKNFYPFLPTPPVVGDVDGDGAEEIVIGTYNPTLPVSGGALNVYSLEGKLKTSIPVAGGVKHIPALADVRGIGRCDVVYRTTLGQVFVQNLGGNSTNNISWATHRGNMRRDGNLGRSLYRAGMALITSRTSGANKATFTWTNSVQANGYSVWRSETPEGPFLKVAALTADTREYTDGELKTGVLYYYELAAEYASGPVKSAPFTVLSLLSGNLLSNSGFEESDNSHWDKWYTGTLGMTNMETCGTEAFQGRRSMRLQLDQQGSSGSIAQFCQYGIPDSTIYVTPGEYYSFGCFIKGGDVTQPSEHWLEWGSTKTGYDTNTRPNVPWPDFFTPAATLGTNSCGWTYINRTFQLPAGFPNVEIYHRFNMAAPGSGSVYLDNLFFRHIPSPKDTNWTSLVPFGAYWKFSTAEPSGSWTSPDFNDSQWPLGKAKFGAGGGPTNISTALPQLKPAYYFRTQFNLPAGQVQDLLLSATCTDDSGGQIYPLRLFINGVEVNCTLDVVTGQGNVTRHVDLTPFAGLLRTGTNVVAARIANYWSDWDDVAFDLSLKAVMTQNPSGRLTISYANPAAPVLSAQTPPGTLWKLESQDNGGPWQTVQTITNRAGGVQSVVDTGQNGRLAPTKVSNRLYRLSPL